MSKKSYSCQECAHASEPVERNGDLVVECRVNEPTQDGFPLMNVNAWCSRFTPDLDLYVKYREVFQERSE